MNGRVKLEDGYKGHIRERAATSTQGPVGQVDIGQLAFVQRVDPKRHQVF